MLLSKISVETGVLFQTISCILNAMTGVISNEAFLFKSSICAQYAATRTLQQFGISIYQIALR